MIDLSKEELNLVISILKQHLNDVEIRAFGSRVNSQAKPYSDFDLAIIGKYKIDRLAMINLKEAFAESNLPFRVDLVDWNNIDKNFQKIINENFVNISVD